MKVQALPKAEKHRTCADAAKSNRSALATLALSQEAHATLIECIMDYLEKTK